MGIAGVLAVGIAGLVVVVVVAVVGGLGIAAGRRPRSSGGTTARWPAYWGDDGRAVVPSPPVCARAVQGVTEQQHPGHGGGGHHGHHGHHGHGGHGFEHGGLVNASGMSHSGGHHHSGGGFDSAHHSAGHHG